MKIEAVLWDYGGVFCESPFATIDLLARTLKHDPQRYFEFIFGVYDRDTDHPWHRLERGELSFEQARAEIIALGAAEGVETDPLHTFAAIQKSSGGKPRAVVIDYARSLVQRGYRTALVTNNIAEFRAHWRASLPLGELFQHVIDSSEVRLRKPDPRIFELALAALGVAPRSAVYLDDYAGNVAAARGLGMQGVLVGDDYRAALAELETLLGS